METNKFILPEHNSLLQMFGYEFHIVCRNMEPSIQKKLVALAPAVFQKWYVSALMEETMLSPANIITSSLQEQIPKDTVYAYTLSIDDKKRGDAKYQYHFHMYSTTEHPIVEDLKTVLNHCLPDTEMTSNGLFSEEKQTELLSLLSQPDIFYLEYLTSIAWHCNLLKHLPSIYSQRVQAIHLKEFFERSVADILKDIVTAVTEITAEHFSESIAADWSFLNSDFFLSYLEGAQEVDQLFVEIYHELGFDIEEIWERSSTDSLETEDSSVLSSFFFMGIIIDKWFLTPLCSYLKIIQPLYFMPYHFINNLNHLSALLTGASDVSLELFTPCSYYSITPLGKALYHQNDTLDSDRQRIPEQLSFDQIMTALERELDLQALEESIHKNDMPEDIIYVYKIWLKNDKRLWKIIEVFSDMKLSDFCSEIFLAFHMEGNSDYLLTVMDHTDFPMTFSAQDSKRSVNKAENISLEELFLNNGSGTFELLPGTDKHKLLEIVLTDTIKYNPFLLYPRIKKQSSMITRLEKTESSF